MPSHWGDRRFNIVTSSSPTGTQFLQAVGCAEASRLLQPGWRRDHAGRQRRGATSEGEFWEALNAACLNRLPVLFLIEDNGYAISVPIECQTAGGNISRAGLGFPDLFRQEVDGTDFLASYGAMTAAAAYCRDGQRSGAGARARHPALLALALRRRAALQDRRRARGRSRARPAAAVSRVPAGRGRARPTRAAAHHAARSIEEVHEATRAGAARRSAAARFRAAPPLFGAGRPDLGRSSLRPRSSTASRRPWWI